MGRITGSWLSGPSAALPKKPTDKPDTYKGESLGLPQQGPGSLVGTGRRVGAIMIDWIMSAGIAMLFIGNDALNGAISTITLLVWLVIGIGTVTIFGFTPGQYFVGIQVARIDGPHKVGFVRALARSVLIVFVAPALITDSDGRGMHDRATGTALVHTR